MEIAAATPSRPEDSVSPERHHRFVVFHPPETILVCRSSLSDSVKARRPVCAQVFVSTSDRRPSLKHCWARIRPGVFLSDGNRFGFNARFAGALKSTRCCLRVKFSAISSGRERRFGVGSSAADVRNTFHTWQIFTTTTTPRHSRFERLRCRVRPFIVAYAYYACARASPAPAEDCSVPVVTFHAPYTTFSRKLHSGLCRIVSIIIMQIHTHTHVPRAYVWVHYPVVVPVVYLA